MIAYQRPSREQLRAAWRVQRSIRGVAAQFLRPGSKTETISHETARRWLKAAGIKVRSWKRRA